jgi:DNA polymerase-3 subunit alpha
MNDFIHLECFSEYSISKSIIRIKELVSKAQELNYPAIALTDTNNLFAAFKFYQAATKAKIKPIFGATLKVDNNYEVILLCTNDIGYKNLSHLISYSYEQTGGVYISFDTLSQYADGLIILNSEKSKIANYLTKNNIPDATKYLAKLNQIFVNRNYIAIKRTGSIAAEDYLTKVVPLASQTNTPIVATNDVLFLTSDDYPNHEAKVCITEGGFIDDDKREKKYSEYQYLTSQAEMKELFSDLPEALLNSVEIAKRCNYKFEIEEGKYFLPDFPIPDSMSANDFFTTTVNNNLHSIVTRDNLEVTTYQERLNFELKIITDLNFTGYFLIVADFIAWAKENDIPVGLGRGSGAGSLVAYCLGITGVDPLKYDLLFERFLNPSRISMPDFDIDFSPTGRDKVIEYVANKYGREKVSQIITFGKMAAKGVVRDAGRVLGMPYGFCDSISKLIPNDLDITIYDTFHYEEKLQKKAEKDKKSISEIKAGKEQNILDAAELVRRYSSEEDVTSLIDLAKELEGLSRNVGTHAGGVIIAPSDIADFCPTYKGLGENDPKVCQFDKNDVEDIGLVKFDFLGLSNLDTIKRTVDIIKDQTSTEIDINQIDLTDDKVYELYRNGDTTGLFQMESAGMRKYLKDLKPTSINDIIAMNALYRPGAMDYIDDYIAVKHGRDISFPHPILKEVLTPTNGVFVYQEQVMRAAQQFAGFSLGDADILRRAMGKKKPEEMAKMRQEFVAGAFKTNEIDEEKANEIFDYIDKFSGYGFNKSHSAAYALISYQTAYLKTYYRSTFMSSVISGVANDTDRVAEMVAEILGYGMIIIPPNVNASEYDWINDGDNTLIYGLGSIKGVGAEFVNKIVEIRSDGKYLDLFDFCLRIPKKYLNKRAIEALIYAGAFADFGQSKKTLVMSYPAAIKHAEISQNSAETGQGLLFNNAQKSPEYRIYTEYSFKELLALEKSVLGFYFSAHPVDEYSEDLEKFNASFLRDIQIRSGKEFATIALIEQVFYKETKKGLSADVILTDGKIKLNTKVFSNKIEQLNDKLKIGNVAYISCVVLKNRSNNEKYKDMKTVIIDNIVDVEELKSKYIKYLTISLTEEHISKITQLKQILLDNAGESVVAINYLSAHNTLGSAFLPAQFNTKASPDLANTINDFLGSNSCKIEYKK